MLGSQRAYLRK